MSLFVVVMFSLPFIYRIGTNIELKAAQRKIIQTIKDSNNTLFGGRCTYRRRPLSTRQDAHVFINSHDGREGRHFKTLI